MASAAHASLQALLGAHFDRAPRVEQVLALGWPSFDAALPDHGLPRAVVQLSAPGVLAGATRVALAAVCAAHARDARTWCAWLDPEATLFAPGVAAAGVDLDRLLVVRPPRSSLMRTAVQVVGSRAFDLVVVDVDPVLGERASSARPGTVERFVRKLALSCEESGATILLLTDVHAASWPVALRLELTRPQSDRVRIYIGKDRRGRSGAEHWVPWRRAAHNDSDEE